MNHLYYGDNLTIMQRMPKGSADLIYLDPPFGSKQNYNLIYKTLTGKPVPEQAEAFCDTWEMDAQKEALAKSMPILMREYGIDDYYIEFWRLWMLALRNTQPHLLAYLIYMVQRLLHMKVILKKTGSIYLHCDPTASHYIKVMMDGIFGHQNFRNEIIWKRTSARSDSHRWNQVHDTILFYSKSDKFTWHTQFTPYERSYVDKFYRFTESDTGRRYASDNLTAAGTREGRSGLAWHGIDVKAKGIHWKYTIDHLEELAKEGRIIFPEKAGGVPRYKRYLDEMPGLAAQSVITDISPLSAQSKERLGYPTQKPLALLDRLVRASSNEGDVVFDPFCGCGTTIYAAEKTGRRWIGCDVAILAVKLVREVLKEKYHLTEGKEFVVSGIPASVEQAEELFKADPFQFQHWAVERAGGFPTQKKSGDLGIDGRMYFEVRDATAEMVLKEMVLSVKGGATIRPADIRDLRGVLEREANAELAGFISLKPPTKAMKDEAAKAGKYTYSGTDYDRMQFLTVGEMVEEKREFHSPTRVGSRISTGQITLEF